MNSISSRRDDAPDTSSRRADLQQSALDRLIALTSALATDRPKDAALLRERCDMALLCPDMLRGTDVLMMRLSTRAISWVDRANRPLQRFHDVDATGVHPIAVDLIELRPREVTMPAVSRLPLEVRR